MTFGLRRVIMLNLAEVWFCGCVFPVLLTDEEGGGV